MADIETLGILDEIQALVSDKLQVVSYKWLSRNFLVPSNTAKRLLQEFVEKNGNQLEVIYSLSGWLKNNSSLYHIKLVPGPKLSDAKQEFDDSCSVQVYSVQACIPKDPAVLWNAEFVQAEELFKEPPNVVNCLRDNRFCGVSNSFVKRNTGGTPISGAAPQLKNVGINVPPKTSSFNETSNDLHHQDRKVEESGPKLDRGKDIQSGSHKTQALQQEVKPVAHKEQIPQLPPSRKKGQNDKSSSGTAGSLASMWGRASAKPKSNSALVEADNDIPISSDAQVHATESLEDWSSGDEDGGMKFKRGSNDEGTNRKRRVVFDFSDEDDDDRDAVSLALPDPPKKKTPVDSKGSPKTSGLENTNLSVDEQKEEKVKVKVKKEKVSDSDPKPPLKEENKGLKTGNHTSNEKQCLLEADASKKDDKARDAAPNSPKRRKVLKTRIDERGREVTEVVWEDDEKGTKADDSTTKNGDSNTANNIVNRPPAPVKKSPVVGNAPSNATGKAGNKKAGNKDPKQGNILSFFKKKV